MSERPTKTLIKICGVTTPLDAAMAMEAGADLVGVLVEIGVSPRSIPLAAARSVAVAAGSAVALTYDASETLNRAVAEQMELVALQLAGRESAETVARLAAEMEPPLWKSVHVDEAAGEDAVGELVETVKRYVEAGAAAIVLDTSTSSGRGGTGTTHDWGIAAGVVKASPVPVYLAGGLNASNVADAIRVVGPYGVDVSSGVESAPGVKDEAKVREFIAAVRTLG